MSPWEWRIGYLASIGPCAWQECDGKMRRITHIIMGPQGQIGFTKPALSVLQNNIDEIPHLNMVVHGVPCDEKVYRDLDRLWSGSMIQPINGNPRIKLT